MQFRKSILAFVPVFSFLAASTAHAQTVIAPGSAATEGNSATSFPFSGVTNQDVQTIRYQQVYNASLFSALSGPSYINSLTFRPDVTAFPFVDTIGSIAFDLSTTKAAANGLSMTFASNIGINAQTVFSGPLTLTSAAQGPEDGPKNFDITVNFQTPFLYDPSQGNLLLDVQRFSPSYVPANDGNAALDAVNSSTDGVSVVYTYNSGVGSPVADYSSTRGLVTEFNAVPAAVPEASTTTSLGLLLALGLGGLVVAKKRVRNAG